MMEQSLSNKQIIGRPCRTNIGILEETLIKYKSTLITKDNNVVSKKNEIWAQISNELKNNESGQVVIKSAIALHTYVCCDKNGVLDKLKDRQDDKSLFEDSSIQQNEEASLSALDLTLNTSVESNVFTFLIYVTGTEFDKLLLTTTVKDKTYKGGTRTRVRLRKGDWAEWITQKIVTNTGRKCAYYFDYHAVNSDASNGHMVGSCDCGSNIDIYLKRNEENVVCIKCTTKEGKGRCGKLYLRATKRKEVAETLQKKTVNIYRAEQAAELMSEGGPEPPTLPKASVLRAAKSAYASTQYMDRDPAKSLEIMQLFSFKDTIHSIGLSPFFTHYSTKHQHTLYRMMANRGFTSIAIDATGSIFRPLIRPDKSRSQHIFLYLIVARSSTGESSSVAVGQMLSERQNTGAITSWLLEWIGIPGLPIPQEVVCDASKALLGAAVTAFARFWTISEYADALYGDHMPRCYIRLDVAHFIKNYANLMAVVRVEVKRFYLASLGKLICCRNIEEARSIVCALLTISLSRSDGYNSDGVASACEKQKIFMDSILTGNLTDEIDLEETANDERDELPTDDGDEQSEKPASNRWSLWALDIKSDVELDIKKVQGKGVNAHMSIEFSKRLIADLAWLPMWSCVVRDKFGYGRIPATSAHVEAEFGKIKNLLLADETLPMRVDMFVKKHIKHINGVTNLVDAAIVEYDKEYSDTEVEPDSADEYGTGFDDNNNSPPSKICKPSNDNAYKNDANGNKTFTTYDDEVISDSEGSIIDGYVPSEKEFHTRPATVVSIIDMKPNSVTMSTRSGNEYSGDQASDGPVTNRPLSNCPACVNGAAPSEAHKCIICNIAVHALEKCSRPYDDEEGCSQKRICNGCASQLNVKSIVEYREVDDWGGFGKPLERRQHKGRYLQEKYESNSFALKAVLLKIPILKNGNKNQLRSVKIGDETIDFINTCAFDSLFHLFLTVSFDSPLFLEQTIIPNVGLSEFFRLLNRVRTQRVNKSTYHDRGKLLCRIYDREYVRHRSSELRCFALDCNTTTSALCQKMLQHQLIVPCFTETIICSKCNNKESRNYTILMVKASSLMTKKYAEAISNELQLPPTDCEKLSCSGTKNTRKSRIDIPGDYILFEVTADFDPTQKNNRDPAIMLNAIPKRLKLPNMEKEFQLRGLIHWKSPAVKTRNSGSLDGIGHYTAFCCRNERWKRFEKTEVSCNEKFQAIPHVLMYSI